MDNTFTPIEVDLEYKHETPVYGIQNIEVDLSYPNNKPLVDFARSAIKRTVSSLTEWGEKCNVGTMYSPRSLRTDSKGLVPHKGKIEVFIFGQNIL